MDWVVAGLCLVAFTAGTLAGWQLGMFAMRRLIEDGRLTVTQTWDDP